MKMRTSIKTKFVIVVISAFLSASLFGQSFDSFSYQAIVRDGESNLISSQQVGIRVSILQGTVDGIAVYTETHSPTTNTNGLLSIIIGDGTSEDDFFAIDWADGPYFLKTETDLEGEDNYTIVGVSQLLSVPYAIHSKSAESITGELNETDPLWTASPSFGISNDNVSDWNDAHSWGDHALAGYITEYSETDPVFSNWDKDYDDLSNKPDLTLYATKDMASQNITNLAEPVNAQDAATKAYVDELLAQIEELQFIVGLKVYDIDGNLYNGIRIGTQIWMTENLRVTHLNDGTVIPKISDNTEWSGLSSEAYCWYDNDSATYAQEYGAMYNWYAGATGKLCPVGWSVPSDADWTVLETYLGGNSVAGGKIKEIEFTHWNSPNTGATNTSGFTALGSGYRLASGGFGGIKDYCYFWSETEYNSTNADRRLLMNTSATTLAGTNVKQVGMSVRCIKD